MLAADEPALGRALRAIDAVAGDGAVQCSCACMLASIAALVFDDAGAERAGLLALCRRSRAQCAGHEHDPAASMAAQPPRG